MATHILFVLGFGVGVVLVTFYVLLICRAFRSLSSSEIGLGACLRADNTSVGWQRTMPASSVNARGRLAVRDYVSLGSAPSEEESVQVASNKNYLPAMHAECRRFLELIRKKLGPEPPGAQLAIKSFPHDFGTYMEVVCYFNDEDEEAARYAFRCESDAPKTWDDDRPPSAGEDVELALEQQ